MSQASLYVVAQTIAKTIRERLHREPFKPFIIRSNSGQSVRLASPDLVVLMKTEVFVAAPNSDDWMLLSCLHISGLENATNGHGRRGRGPNRPGLDR